MNRVLNIIFHSLLVGAISTGLYSPPASGKDKKDDRNNINKVLGNNAQERELKGELLITANEEKAIRQLKVLLKRHKGSPLEVGLWFRMAELHLRRSKTARFFEMNRESDSVVRFAPTTVTKVSSKRHILEGIEIYEMIQKRFPRYRDMDLVYFNNAFARQQIGQLNEAKRVYKNLLKLFPDSVLVPDTNLALGEMYFDELKYKDALEYFLAIKNYPESIVYPYGLYKTAWSYYNLQNTALALKSLEEVVAFGRKVEKEQRQHKLDLRKEALGDMVLFFSEYHPSSKAVSYFSQQADKQEIGGLLLRLAALYGHHSKYADLQLVLNNFIDKYPMSKERAKAHFELINASETLKRPLQAVVEMKRLKDLCVPKSSWFSTHMEAIRNEKEQTLDCEKLLASSSSTLATKWHKVWKKNPNDEDTGKSAESAYEIYLAVTPKDEKYIKAGNSFADLLFQRKKFRQASDLYFEVAQLSKDKKIRHDSTYSALVSLEKAVGKSWNDKDEKRFGEVGGFYLLHNPKEKYAVEVQFQIGFIAYERGNFNKASEVFKALAQVTPVDEKVLKAQDLYLDILNARKDFTTIKILALEWSKNDKTDRKIKLKKIYEESYFAEIQRNEETGKFKEAADSYKAFTVENPSSPLADKAKWNAVQLEYKLGDLAAAAESGFQFYKLFPKSEKAKESLMKSAQTFEFIGQLKRTADALDDLAAIDDKSREKWISLASDFRFLEGDLMRARNGYSKLIDSKDSQISNNAVLKLVDIEKRTGNIKALSKLQNLARSRRYEPLHGEMTLANLNNLFDKQSFKEAFESASQVLRDKSHTNRTIAGARFIQAKILDKEFRDQSIVSSPERLTLVLKIKTEKLDKAQSAYRDVIRYGDPEYIVRAMQELALCYDHYVKSIRNIRFTKPLPEEEMEALHVELEKVTTPMEDKAVDTLSQALQHAKKFELRDGIIAQLQNNLNALNLRPQVTKVEVRTPTRVLPFIVGGES